jgi:hypothetical protein
MSERELEGRAQRRPAVLRHVEEVSGNVAATCRYYGISRQCYYGWLRRFEADGLDGIEGPIPAALSLTAGHPSRQRGEDHLAAAAVRSIDRVDAGGVVGEGDVVAGVAGFHVAAVTRRWRRRAARRLRRDAS